jgi:serralysin
MRSGVDDIDLRTIDANGSAAGNAAFRFIGTAAFSDSRGELRFTDLGSNCVIQADLNGDGRADFEIMANRVGTLVRGDFFL